MLGEPQKIILLIFTLLLIIIFGIVIWTFVKGDVESWPPTSQTCPDYWKETTPGVCYKNANGSCDNATQINFTNISSCDKYTWSTGGTTDIQSITGSSANCGIVQWDGINYGNGKYTPCDPQYTPSEL